MFLSLEACITDYTLGQTYVQPPTAGPTIHQFHKEECHQASGEMAESQGVESYCARSGCACGSSSLPCPASRDDDVSVIELRGPVKSMWKGQLSSVTARGWHIPKAFEKLSQPKVSVWALPPGPRNSSTSLGSRHHDADS